MEFIAGRCAQHASQNRMISLVGDTAVDAGLPRARMLNRVGTTSPSGRFSGRRFYRSLSFIDASLSMGDAGAVDADLFTQPCRCHQTTRISCSNR